MKAAVLKEHAEIFVEGLSRRYPDLPLKEDPLEIIDMPLPTLEKNKILIEIEACGVCYTDIDIIEGRVRCKLPLVLGHQIVGRIVDTWRGHEDLVGERVGVAWIGWSCGSCEYCRRGLENLCRSYKATGCDFDGGYAEYTTAYVDYIYRLPKDVDGVKLAPLMCAGSIGYRAYKLANISEGSRVGLFGFGSSAHIVIQIIRRLHPSTEIYVFSRGAEHRDLAKKLGADWTGHPSEDPPKKINVAIDFTPVGETISRALELMDRGGRLVINAIRKQTPVLLDYTRHLWEEKEIKSVANVTRDDVRNFIDFYVKNRIETHIQIYRLEDVNRALKDLKAARTKGSPVLKIR
ncbi:MAG: zinc-binding alcohol dehydrogenase family protein [Desulfurococcales archaeon]|jgi:propanol-preferring alcohol dehydrogenase|nr:zinc-binding alcohol dehydrogenase family protein [Desulfurococcales archaeon]